MLKAHTSWNNVWLNAVQGRKPLSLPGYEVSSLRPKLTKDHKTNNANCLYALYYEALDTLWYGRPPDDDVAEVYTKLTWLSISMDRLRDATFQRTDLLRTDLEQAWSRKRIQARTRLIGEELKLLPQFLFRDNTFVLNPKRGGWTQVGF